MGRVHEDRVNIQLVMVMLMENEMKKLLGSRVVDLVLNDLSWFVRLYWFEVVKGILQTFHLNGFFSS